MQAALRSAGMVCKLMKIVALLCALGGCSMVQQKTETDASTAAMIAANTGDAAGAACFKALEPVVGTAPTGFISKFEVVRTSQLAVENGPCGPLAGSLFLHLLNKFPGTP